MIKDCFARWIPGVFELTRSLGISLRELGGGDPHSDYQGFLHINTTRNPFRLSLKGGLFFCFSSPSCPFFLFQTKISRYSFSDNFRCLLELRLLECPGIGNYERPRIFRGFPHTSNVVAVQTLELLNGWKSWRSEISEVSLHFIFFNSVENYLLGRSGSE